MRTALLASLLWLPALLALETRTVHEFGDTPLPAAVSVGGGVTLRDCDDPLGVHGRVVRTDWPAWAEGRPEWPAIRFPGGSFPVANWDGWDALRVTVLNPSDGVADLGICLRGNGKRLNVHRPLQPNVWNSVLVPMAEIRSALERVDHISSFDLFMTRPPKEFVLHLKKLDLVRLAPPGDARIPLVNVFGGFETPEALSSWNRNGVQAERVREPVGEGAWAVRVVYPQHREGNPPWPSLQAWVAQGTMPEDWSLYQTLAFGVRNPGGQTTIKLCLRDARNRKFTRLISLGAAADTACSIDLCETGLDLAAMRQLDFFLTRPEAAVTVVLDNVRLVTVPAAEAQAVVTRYAAFRESLGDLPTADRAPFEAELKQRTSELERLASTCKGPMVQPGALRAFRKQLLAAGEWLDGASREGMAARCRAAAARRVPGAQFGIGIADSMTKVMIRDMPLDGVRIADGAELELAANEYESLQVVVLGARRPLRDVAVTVGELKGEGGSLPASAVETALVGHVQTKQPPYEVPYVGWWPDPILDFQKSAPVAPGEAVSFWVRVRAPQDARAGTYSGTITVSADDAPPVPVPFAVTVFGFAVPSRGLLPTATDFRDHIRQVYGRDLSQEEYGQRLDQFRDLFASYKIDLDRIYRGGSMTPEKVNLYLDELRNLRDRGLLTAFNICYVGTDRSITDPDHPSVKAAIDRTLATLRYWVPILEREGLLKYAYVYGYDEVPAKCFPVMAKVLGAIKAEFPNIPLMTTAYDHSFGADTVLRDVVDIHVPLTPRFDPERVAAARARGKDVWWYICIGPKHPYANWLIEYPAIESRLLMGMMAAKYRPGGFLYYALTRWPVNKGPITDGPYTNWNPMSYKDNNGDGSIFCAGPDGPLGTIRAENFRDGMEDYAYYRILEERIEAVERKGADHAPQLAAARAALAVSQDVVASLDSFTHDPTRLRAERRKVAHQIEVMNRFLDAN